MEEFIRILTKNYVKLNIDELQIIYKMFEQTNSGNIQYEHFFKALLDFFHSPSRHNSALSLYNQLSSRLGHMPTSKQLKAVFDAECHPSFLNGKCDKETLLSEYYEMVESYQFVYVAF